MEKASLEMPISPALVAMSKIVPASMAIKGLRIWRTSSIGRLAAIPATGSLAQSEASSWGVIAEREQDFTQALRYYKKAQSLLTNDDVNLLINMGRVLGKLGEKNQALDTLEKALTLTQADALKAHIRALIKEISG